MDYLAKLPIEIWTTIIQVTIGLAVNWPPSDARTFLWLDKTYGQPGAEPMYDATIRSQIRLVCSSFKMLADCYDQSKLYPKWTDDVSTRSLVPLPSDHLTALTIRLNARTANAPKADQQLEDLWKSASSLPSLRVLTIDEPNRLSSNIAFWEPLNMAFPQLESLALRVVQSYHLPPPQRGSMVTLKRLRHLYMPNALVQDLPSLPSLTMIKLYLHSSWKMVVDRAPNLETISFCCGTMNSGEPLTHWPFRYVECKFSGVQNLPDITETTNIELLILTVHLTSPDATKAIVAAVEKLAPKSIYLNSTAASGYQGIVYRCAQRGITFDRTYVQGSSVTPHQNMVKQL